MKEILIHSFGAHDDNLFRSDERDSCNDPLIYLRDKLSSLGIKLRTSDDYALDDCEWVVFHDSSSVNPYPGFKGGVKRVRDRLAGRASFRNLYRECLNAGMNDKIALFLWEAPAVDPNNWVSELHDLFPVIFTWNDSFVDGKKYHKIYIPQSRIFPKVEIVPFVKKKLLVNISMNKCSNHSRELYSARRSSIRYFERTQPEGFDLYGVGWERPINVGKKVLSFMRGSYPSYRGTVKNKWDVLPGYRFSLCYENINGEPGYVTEKIFDCMRAGCVPIYWGASNITDYVAKEAFIDRRDFASDVELGAYLLSIGERRYENFKNAIQDYLRSDLFAKFHPSAYADTVIRVLSL
jgi:alpha(1,3/1,4) fucosyltransferase